MLSFTPIGVVTLIVYLVVAAGIGIKKRVPVRQQILPFVLFVYLLGVIAVTLFPIPITPAMLEQRHMNPGQQFYNLVPLSTVWFMIQQHNLNAIANLAGNVALFVPFGFLVPLVFTNLARASKIVPLGFAVTFLVESCQFLISYTMDIFFRSFDVDDMILNTLGVVVGYLLLRLLQRLSESR